MAAGSEWGGTVGRCGGARRVEEACRSREVTSHMHTVIKDSLDVHIIKKFGDTFISSCFFILTSIPLWLEGMLTEVTELQKVRNALRCPKLAQLFPLNDERAPLVIFFFLTVLFLCLPDSRAAEDLGGAALGVLRDRGPWGRVRGRGAATARGGAARGGRIAPSSPPRRRRWPHRGGASRGAMALSLARACGGGGGSPR